MAAPPFVPVDPVDRPRAYESPAYVPGRWIADRPAAVTGRQPAGARLGAQGPDQGYALLLAARLRDKVRVDAGEDADDAMSGALGVALRRASLFGRAPVVHDLTVALMIWGFLDENPPAELVELRRRLFEGVSHTAHHYGEWRNVVDSVPEATLRLTPAEVALAYPGQWRNLIGASA